MEKEKEEATFASGFANEEEAARAALVSKFASECRVSGGWGKRLARAVKSGLEEAWDLLDENRALINELDHNRDSETGDDLALNIALLGELNENMHRAADLYAGLSAALAAAAARKTKARKAKEAGSESARPE
ncbi:protein ELF4-LIKE 3-like isoform X3 [Ananas comosus]|uniref:Protein ELF4-LIKE 3-like isoform X3 n=1 Tax=Ananas comosus TaxID=4615 RepID=A0A6P5GYK8_ANACO|nr:protein ELF4-LIKE 3-like isoform X3 [Ananas comosus]